MADTVDDTTAEAQRVADAARAEPTPTVVLDDPDETGLPEGTEVVTGGEPPAPEPQPKDESIETEVKEVEGDVEAGVSRLAGTLGDLTRRELERLEQAIQGELRSKGGEPGKAGPTMSEKASRLPINEKATKELSAEEACKPFVNIQPGDLLAWTVRQKQDAEGGVTGPAYLRISTRSGKKLTAIHNSGE